MVFLAAIEDLSYRYALGEFDADRLQSAMLRINDQSKLALRLFKQDKPALRRLTDEWDKYRVNQESPRYLKDPKLEEFEQHVKGVVISIKDLAPIPNSETEFHFNFEFHCEDCGGYMMHVPDNPDDHSMTSCTACGKEYGTYLAVRAFCQWKGQQELKRLRLGEYAAIP